MPVSAIWLICKVVGGIPAERAGLAALLGAAVFPICLVCILIGGGELVTGNIMSLGSLTKTVSVKLLARNRLIVSLGNLDGAVAMAVEQAKSVWISVVSLFLPSRVIGWGVRVFGFASA